MGLIDQLVDPASLEAVAVDAAAALAAGTLKAKRKPKGLVNKLIEDTPFGRAVVWKKVSLVLGGLCRVVTVFCEQRVLEKSFECHLEYRCVGKGGCG